MGDVFRLTGRRRYLSIATLAGACGFAALAIGLSESGRAAFPGINGKIVFSNGQSYSSQSIYAANSDGSSISGLTSSTNDYWPSYSPDGSRIAFNRQNGIVVMNADGSGQTQIVAGVKNENTTTKWQASYKDPNSSRIVPEVKIEIHHRSGHSFYSPVFTADGTQLVVAENVFDRMQESICAVEAAEDTECISGYANPEAYFHYHFECHECVEHLVALNASTGAVTGQVTPKVDGVSDFFPAVSVNGKIAFNRYVRGSAASSGIFIVSSPGGVPSQLTSGYGNYSPDFSPDGSKIVFAHNEREIGMIGVGGGAITLLPAPAPTPETYEYVEGPKFSPDSTEIVFYRDIYHFHGGDERGIFVMNADGSGSHRILEGYDATWQPVPPPPPPTPPTASAKGVVKLKSNGRAVVGSIICGSSPCTLKVLFALLKVHQPRFTSQKSSVAIAARKTVKVSKTYKVKTSVPMTLAPGQKGDVKVAVKGKALIALDSAHKGSLTLNVRVSDALGSRTLTLKATLKPPRARKTKK